MILLNILYNICVVMVFKHHVDGLYNDFYINFMYKLIYLYSAFQIKMHKYIKTIPTFDILKTFNIKKTNKYLHFYHDGLCCFIEKLQDGETIFHRKYSFISYDFILFSDVVEGKQIFKIYKFIKESYKTINFKYELSSIKFIALILNYDGNQYNIELESSKINYYIVDNIIDKDFILYYYRTIINSEYSSENKFEYTLSLCDEKADMFTLEQNDIIILHKVTYEIKYFQEEFSESDESITDEFNYYDEIIKMKSESDNESNDDSK